MVFDETVEGRVFRSRGIAVVHVQHCRAVLATIIDRVVAERRLSLRCLGLRHLPWNCFDEVVFSDLLLNTTPILFSASFIISYYFITSETGDCEIVRNMRDGKVFRV